MKFKGAIATVNENLKALGEAPRLRRGRGYYYFDGPATSWPNASVYVSDASEMSVAEWMNEYFTLKTEAGKR